MTQGSFHKQDTKPSSLEKEPTSPLPEKIGPYKVETLLSKGSMSWLYMGIDPTTKTPVVIKVLPKKLLKDKQTVESFLKESKLTALAEHPNIVKLYGEGSFDNGLYIAMEWVQGISLRQFLTKQSFSLKRSLDIILQICYALKHLHEHQIIHKDLKPENILITEEGAIKVIDFGIAQTLKDGSSTIAGTPNYMSPEQKKDPSQVGFPSDIYSLGVLAYELILGKLSYGVIDLSLLPPSLRKIIQKTLAVSISQRYQTIDALIKDLLAYLTSGEIDKEKPEQDQSTELLEIFQKNSSALSSFPPPTFSYADVGMGKIPSTSKFGLYYELFPLPGDAFFIFIAEPLEQGLDPLFSAASLRGVVRTLVTETTRQFTQSFDTLQFIQTLQKQILFDSFISSFAISYLYADAIEGVIRFYNAGLSQLIYTSAGEKSRFLFNGHPLLSDGKTEFVETTEKWNIGDVIIYHSLILDDQDHPDKKQAIEDQLLRSLKEQMFLSAQAQADVLTKEFCQTSFFSSDSPNKVLFSIQRTG